MLILSVDTSCSICRVGVWEDGKIISEFSEDNKKSHSVKLMPMIESALLNCNKTISDVDIFAPINGPGSYTGLRIGVTTCKLLGYSCDKPVVPVNTLDYLAYSLENLSEGTLICSCIDARNSRVFYGLYITEFSSNENTLYFCRLYDYDADEVSVVSEKIKECMRENNVQNLSFCGDGFVANKEFFINSFNSSVIQLSQDALLGKSQAACDIAMRLYDSSKDKNIFHSKNTEVYYLRMPHITLKKDIIAK